MATTVGGLGEREKRCLIVRYKPGDLVATIAEQADMSSAEQFPGRSQITFGGGPRRTLNRRKSSSLVTIVRPWSRACSQIA